MRRFCRTCPLGLRTFRRFMIAERLSERLVAFVWFGHSRSRSGPLPGHSRGTESRNQEDLGGPGRTRSKQQSNTSGHLRSREDTGGHVTNTVRDREAPGSNPGPPTNPYARVARNALTLVVCGSSSSCLYRDDSTAISAILPATLL